MNSTTVKERVCVCSSELCFLCSFFPRASAVQEEEGRQAGKFSSLPAVLTLEPLIGVARFFPSRRWQLFSGLSVTFSCPV